MPRRSRRSYRGRRTTAEWYRAHKRRIDVAIAAVAVAGFVAAGWGQLSGGTGAADPAPAAQPSAVRPAASAPVAAGPEAAVAAALRVTEWGDLDPSLDELRARPTGCTEVRPDNLAECSYGDPGAARTAVVLGDSIAMAWVPAVRAALGDGWRVQMLTRSECPAPVLETWRNRTSKGTAYAACLEHRAWALEQIRQLRPDLVVASSLPDFANRIVGIEPSEAARKYAAWRDGTAALLRAVGSFTGRAVVLGAPPSSGNLQTCVTARSEPADCVEPVTRHWTAVAAAEAAAARTEGATHVNPVDWFCLAGRCPAVVGTTPVMRDGTHLTDAYARQLAPVLRPALLGALPS